MQKKFLPRLSGWLVSSVLLFALIGWTSPAQIPVTIYKLSLVSLSAVLGYWLDRSLFPWARPDSFCPWEELLCCAAAMIRRAILVAATCLAVALGL
ncbi:putative holin [Enterobacter hormaechei]|uniref:putative holin n=1 Tax=Enterobacter hormaechei TaxID=158836 RepID=UPI00293030E3|nr:putative holin [Enterobacter hormaechei]WNZ51584.1 putative holin [Enterobacter hormaechei subsp. xiangfangensis]